MELMHQSGDIINNRYRILSNLGRGGLGFTYLAEVLANGQKVAIKALSFRHADDWKAIELFEREAKTLSQLDHPCIPRYIDHFQLDTDGNKDRAFYIVQQLAEGDSLAVAVDNGWHPTEAEVKCIAAQVLEVLIYLQSLVPPIIHRDIKPQNLIRHPNGQLFLVDFGAVRDTYHDTVTGGSTIIGTFGYMAPEQFRGHAVLSTDLYGLGTTLLFLLAGKPPSELPRRRLKINFRDYVKIAKPFAAWLDKLIEPVIENRIPTAKVALDILQGQRKLADYNKTGSHRPRNTGIKIIRDDDLLIIKIPPPILTRNRNRFLIIVSILAGLIVWNFFFLTVSFNMGFLAFFMGLFVPVLFGIGFLVEFVFDAFTSNEIWISHNCKSQMSTKKYSILRRSLNIDNIQEVILEGLNPFKTCSIYFKSREIQGDQLSCKKLSWLLSEAEKDLLIWEITDYLKSQG